MQETEESKDHRVSMDSRACLETKDHLENLGNQVTWVFPESWEQWDRLDQGESAEFLVKEEKSVQPAFKDPKESLDPLVQMDPRVVLDQPGPWETQDPLVCRDSLERGVSPDHRGPKATEVISGKKDPKVHLEMMVLGVLPDLLAHWDPQALAVKRGSPDPKAQQGPTVPEESTEPEVTLDRPERWDSPDHPALTASLE